MTDNQRFTEAGRSFYMAHILTTKGPRTPKQLAHDLNCTVRNVYYLRDSIMPTGLLTVLYDGRFALRVDGGDEHGRRYPVGQHTAVGATNELG